MKINFNKSELRKILSNRIIFYFSLFSIINFIAFVPMNSLVIDIISHFLMQYLVICLIFIPLIFIFIQPKKNTNNLRNNLNCIINFKFLLVTTTL